METQSFINKTKDLIDDLKGVCAKYGLGNDGNEFKIITQSFLYKFMNDKFVFETKQIDKRLENSQNWEKELKYYSEEEYKMLLLKMSPSSAKLKREHFLSYLHNNQNMEEFGKLFDDTLRDISIFNNDVFSVKTESGARVVLFDELTQYITDPSKRDDFARAIINQLVNFSFESVFEQKFDFFSTIFEYLIKDYNKDGGGKYAEYYTPHAVAKIMSAILVDKPVSDVTVYDPSAGSGTLLMGIAHAIGEDKCTIYSQDISQKSSGMLRLNLILNNLVHSISNVIQGDTLLLPYHREGKTLKKFDFIVSNPPFKLDFSDIREDLDTKENSERFFAGIPTVPKKKKESMSIYLLFLQHIIYSLTENGKAAVVVPSGFCTDTGSIERSIREYLIDEKILKGVVHFPSNVFANTNTSVSVLFIDKSKINENVMFVDASKLGETVKEGDLAKTNLNDIDLHRIINIFNEHQDIPEFSKSVAIETIKDTDYMIKAGLFFSINRELLSNNTKNLDREAVIYSQRMSGLKMALEDSIFRNILIGKIVKAEVSKDNKFLKYEKIGALLNLTLGGDWGKAFQDNKYNTLVRCIRGADLPQLRYCNYENIPVRYLQDGAFQKKMLKINDIIIEISGGSPIQSTGRMGLITKEILQDLDAPVICTNFCRILRFKDDRLAIYVYHYLQLLYDHGQMFNLENNTSGIKNLIFPAFLNTIIPIPKEEGVIKDIYEEVKIVTRKYTDSRC